MLERADEKPPGMLECISNLHHQPTADTVMTFYQMVANFRAWEVPDVGWANQFMIDSELSWLSGTTAVDDL